MSEKCCFVPLTGHIGVQDRTARHIFNPALVFIDQGGEEKGSLASSTCEQLCIETLCSQRLGSPGAQLEDARERVQI